MLWRRVALVALCALAGSLARADEMVTVTVKEAPLYGRPAVGAITVGTVRRGHKLRSVRTTADGRWLQVDTGDGLAWLEARSVHDRSDGDRLFQRDDDAPIYLERIHEEQPPQRERSQQRERADQPPPARRARPTLPPHGPNYFELRVRAGVAIVDNRVVTNGVGEGLLHSYESGTDHLAVRLELAYARAFGKLHVTIDGRYLFAALGSVAYTPSSGPGFVLSLREQVAGVGFALGAFFPKAGGVDLRFRVGAQARTDQVSQSVAPLAIASDIVVGMTAGIELVMPALGWIGGRPFGFRLRGGALAPAARFQQQTLHTTPNNFTYGGYAGISVHQGLLANPRHGQLYLDAGYDFAVVLTHFTGACPATTSTAQVCRDDTVDSAHQGTLEHILGVGLYYRY